MLKHIRENIDNAQEQAKQKIGLNLGNTGYELVTDIHNKDGVETRIFQWTNAQRKHCIQLIWNGKENWFDLGEFHITDNLGLFNATQILLIPFNSSKFFNRKNYINRVIDKLVVAIFQFP